MGGADADIRAAAREILQLDDDGKSDEALARADALAAAHPESAIAHRLVGDLHYAAAVDVDDGNDSEEAKKLALREHLSAARDALMTARRLAPDCVDVAGALGDVFRASKMYNLAKTEFLRAQRLLCPSDPAENNAAYSMYEEEGATTAAERVKDARERARVTCSRMMVEELVPLAVKGVLETARQYGAAEGRMQGKRLAEGFPNVARAQYLKAYMDLEFVRGLDASIDRRAFLRRIVTMAERAAQIFPMSLVIASFHARLLFVLGDYDAAENVCRRALALKEPDDPQQDCIPPGSVSGEDRDARLLSLASEFHEVLERIKKLANDYWRSMSRERQEAFLTVRLDALQDEYSKIDWSSSITMSDVQSFVNEKGSWWFWICPVCNRKKFLDPGSLLAHMCSKHPRVVLPRLQSVVDPKFSEKVLERDGSLDGVSLSQDSDQKDVVTFDRRSESFKWLFYAPYAGLAARPLPKVLEFKRQKGITLLESIKEKMKTLPADKSATEFAEAVPEINDLWRDFLKTSVLNYRAFILSLARPFLWKEMKKFISEDQRAATKFISTADIDAVFTKKDSTDKALKVTESHEESEVHATVNDTASSDAPINVTESVSDLDTEMKSLQIDPDSHILIEPLRRAQVTQK